jgi:hypothetical protein
MNIEINYKTWELSKYFLEQRSELFTSSGNGLSSSLFGFSSCLLLITMLTGGHQVKIRELKLKQKTY